MKAALSGYSVASPTLSSRTNVSGASLAIVIPYYKPDYFEDLMEALSRQLDQNFHLYIVDDCSKSSPIPILKRFRDIFAQLTYVKFEKRLGHVCLASHWNRCLQVCKREEWAWLLPDDDIPSANCVSAFRKALLSGFLNNANVAVFPSSIINSCGDVVVPALFEGPKVAEPGYSFYMRQLLGQSQGSTLGENIFRLSALRGVGGFVPFPKAWGSDHATILLTASNSNIAWISDAHFYFRQSGLNISSNRSDGHEKMKAKFLYARWLRSMDKFIFNEANLDLFYRLI
mgnify:CR=1 FL=1